MTPNDIILKFSDKWCDEKVCDCNDKISEESEIKKHSLLKKCDEINKQYNDSFISDIKFGLDNGKLEEKTNIIKQYSPTMKMVFRHNGNIIDYTPELLFDINMVKSEPKKLLKEFGSLKTVNKLFKFDTLNKICIKRFSKLDLDPTYNEKDKSNNETFFKTGYLSLDFDFLQMVHLKTQINHQHQLFQV